MIALPYLSVTRCSGVDAGDFLHNQLSADIKNLDDGSSTFACYCDPKGRVLCLVLVYRSDDAFYMIMSAELAHAVATRLKIYVMRSKVNIETMDGQMISGLRQAELPESKTGSTLFVPLPDNQHCLVVTEIDLTADKDSVLTAAWKSAELQRGITWLNAETSGQFLPQMLGFDGIGAVNFRKGCYPGQEIVARTHYLGKLKRFPRQLVTLKACFPAPLEKINIIFDGSSDQAVVVDCAENEVSGTSLFVVTRMDPALEAEKIEIKGELFQLA